MKMVLAQKVKGEIAKHPVKVTPHTPISFTSRSVWENVWPPNYWIHNARVKWERIRGNSLWFHCTVQCLWPETAWIRNQLEIVVLRSELWCWCRRRNTGISHLSIRTRPLDLRYQPRTASVKDHGSWSRSEIKKFTTTARNREREIFAVQRILTRKCSQQVDGYTTDDFREQSPAIVGSEVILS